MQLLSSEREGVSLLTVSGEIDLSNSPELRRQLEHHVLGRRRAVVVDLSGIEHIDSSGIAVLIEGKNWARQNKRGFVLAQPSERVRMVIELARLDRFFAIEDATDAAIARARRHDVQ